MKQSIKEVVITKSKLKVLLTEACKHGKRDAGRMTTGLNHFSEYVNNIVDQIDLDNWNNHYDQSSNDMEEDETVLQLRILNLANKYRVQNNATNNQPVI